MENNVIVLMRHSIRLDNDDSATWEDKILRPYDSPIVDFDLPRNQAEKLKDLKISVVVSSPLRRCLQTSGIICRHLGIQSIIVDYGLTEAMNAVRRTGTTTLSFLDLPAMQAAVGEGVAISEIRGAPPMLSEDFQDSVDRYQATFEAERRFSPLASALLISHGYALETFASRFLRPSKELYDVQECGFIVADSADYSFVRSDGIGFI